MQTISYASKLFWKSSIYYFRSYLDSRARLLDFNSSSALENWVTLVKFLTSLCAQFPHLKTELVTCSSLTNYKLNGQLRCYSSAWDKHVLILSFIIFLWRIPKPSLSHSLFSFMRNLLERLCHQSLLQFLSGCPLRTLCSHSVYLCACACRGSFRGD